MSDTRSPQVLPTRKHTQHLERFSEADIPTERGSLRTIVFRTSATGGSMSRSWWDRFQDTRVCRCASTPSASRARSSAA